MSRYLYRKLSELAEKVESGEYVSPLKYLTLCLVIAVLGLVAASVVVVSLVLFLQYVFSVLS